MYQLIVIVVQFCFAYPKSKPLVGQQDDTLASPGVTKSINCGAGGREKMKSRWRAVEGDQDKPSVGVGKDEGEDVKGESQDSIESVADFAGDNHRGGDTLTPTPSASNSPTSGSPSCPLSVVPESLVQKNVNITVSYNPPKSLYTSFDQLRSPRPNCFISSIARVDGHPCTSPGSAVKTTEIKSPEEMTGVKSPSPEAWRVAIDTGNGISWTQSKPVTNNTVADPNNKVNNTIDSDELVDEVFFMGKSSKQSTNKLTTRDSKSSNHQQSTVPETNKHLDGPQTIQIVTKETPL